MIFIAHRGNLTGRNPERENTKKYIKEALNARFEVEIDIFGLNSTCGIICVLGHDIDTPGEEVDFKYLMSGKHNLWIHCKNKEAYNLCHTFGGFQHSNEPFIYIPYKDKYWHFPNDKNIGVKSIVLMPDVNNLPLNVAGYCADNIKEIKEKYLELTK